MKRIAVALFLSLAGSSHSIAQEQIVTGNDLQVICQIADTHGAPKAPEEVIKSGMCIGFVTAIMRTSTLLDGRVKFCIPTGVTIAQAIKVVLKYSRDHSEITNNGAEVISIMAFATAWPCKN